MTSTDIAKQGWLTIAVIASLPLTLSAGDGGSLLGTITDPSGKAVPGAKVTALETSTSVKQTFITDLSGFYSFQNLGVGRYSLEIEAAGFKPLLRAGVVIDVNSKVVVDATLVVGEKSEAITVSQSAAQVETADTQIGAR